MDIHSTAIISADAVVGENVKIGPFSIIEEGVSLGDNCEIAASAQVLSADEMTIDALREQAISQWVPS